MSAPLVPATRRRTSARSTHSDHRRQRGCAADLTAMLIEDMGGGARVAYDGEGALAMIAEYNLTWSSSTSACGGSGLGHDRPTDWSCSGRPGLACRVDWFRTGTEQRQGDTRRIRCAPDKTYKRGGVLAQDLRVSRCRAVGRKQRRWTVVPDTEAADHLAIRDFVEASRALRRSPRCEGSDVSLYAGHPFRGVHEREGSDTVARTALARGAAAVFAALNRTTPRRTSWDRARS